MRQRIAVFAVSAVALAFELATIRLASFMLPAQYAYFLLAVAALGSGLGSALVARGRLRAGARLASYLGLSFTMSSLGMTLPWPSGLRPLAFLAFAGLPYMAVGAWLSGVFSSMQRSANTLYFCDLAGAATGVGIGYWALQAAGPVPLLTAAAVGGLGLAAAILTRRKTIAVITAATVVALSVVAGSWAPIVAGALTPSGEKPMGEVERVTGKPIWTGWNSFGRVDVLKLPDSDRQVVFTDGSAATEMVGYDGNPARIADLLQEPGSLPFQARPGAKTLLIGPGGGKDILMALQGGSKDITAVELNPLIVKAVTDLSAFSGDPYHLPGVKAVVGDGRAYVRNTADRFDLIYLSLVMTGTAERTGWGLAENYVYTVQAVNEYIDHLSPGGQLAFVLHEQSDLVRAISLSLEALMARGESLPQAAGHIAVFVQAMGHGGTQHGRPVLIVSREPINAAVSSSLMQAAAKTGASPVFVPGLTPTGALPELVSGKLSYQGFVQRMAQNGIDASPATDDRPYFYMTSNSANWIFMTLVAVAALGMGILSYGLGGKHSGRSLHVIAAASGFGFMAVEVALIQSLRLLINEPTLSVVGTLLPLLAASGIGSMLSGRLPVHHRRRAVAFATIFVALSTIVYASATGILANKLTGSPLWERLLIAAMIIGIPGLAMGFPFPFVLANSGQPADSWTINGVTSVIGSVAAVLISMSLGVSYTLYSGAAAYALIGVIALLDGRADLRRRAPTAPVFRGRSA